MRPPAFLLTILDSNLTRRGRTTDTFGPKAEPLEQEAAQDATLPPRQYSVEVTLQHSIGVELDPLHLPIEQDVLRALLMTGLCVKTIITVYPLVDTLIKNGTSNNTY